MSAILSFKCPEEGCPMDIRGMHAEEMTEILLVHNKFNHRKSFERTPLGKLPPEIMLKILGYVIPDCKKCFLQRNLMRLGLVCKKLNQLTKTADLYREVRLTDECCPLPTLATFASMIENSGAKMKRINCNYRCKDLLSVALQRWGDVIEQVHVENMNELSSLHVPALMLEDINWTNPKGLKLIKFKNITFTVAKKTRKEPFCSRIYDLNINWIDTDIPSIGYCALFPSFALRHIKSLHRVTVNFLTDDPITTKSFFQQGLDPNTLPSHYKLLSNYKEGDGSLEITVERSTEYPQFEMDPESAFNAFLWEMKEFSC